MSRCLLWFKLAKPDHLIPYNLLWYPILFCNLMMALYLYNSIFFLLILLKGVLDITTTEVADYVVGGVMACDSSRFDAIIEKRIPLVLSVGALDMVNFGVKDTIPSSFRERKIYEHNKQVISLSTLFFVLFFSF